MHRSYDMLAMKFNGIIGEVQRTYAELSESRQNDIADFQAGLLAIYNKKTPNQSIAEFLKEVGLKSSLYAIGTRDDLDTAKVRAGVTEEDVAVARKAVDSKEGLSYDVPGFAKVGVTLGYISPKAGDLCMEAQAYVRALGYVNSIEDVIQQKPDSGADKDTINSFSLKLVSDLTGKETAQEVLASKAYARVNGDRDPDGLKLAQITMVLADMYSSKLKHDVLFQNDLSLDEGYKNNFKQEIAKGMARVAEGFAGVGFNGAASDLLTIRENIQYEHDAESHVKIYADLPTQLHVKAFENARFLEEKLSGFKQSATVAQKNIGGTPHP